MKDQVENRKEAIKKQAASHILDKYGGEEHLKERDSSLIYGQGGGYTEYTRAGKIKNDKNGALEKLKIKAKAKSRYDEDIMINNHTCVWGSLWKNGRWGYKCCKSFIKQSYCLGEAGKKVNEENLKALETQNEASKAQQAEEDRIQGIAKKQIYDEVMKVEADKMAKRKRKIVKKESSSESSSSSSSSSSSDSDSSSSS